MSYCRVLLIGEEPILSSPSLTLALALRKLGVEVEFANDVERRSTKRWLELVRGADAVVYVQYETLDFFLLRQLALAASTGTPVYRWWVGSDVIRPLRCPLEREYALVVQKFTSGQITVSPHLVDELATIGINATFIPSVLDPGKPPSFLNDVPKRLLVYLPSRRREFYGGDIVFQAAKAYPDLEFLIVADDVGYWEGFENVRSLGWVEDMDPIWERVGGVLRVTEHDGLPRMVLDGLRRGKHVFYSWPLDGCILTRTAEDVRRELERFRALSEINYQGIHVARALLDPPPEKRWLDLIKGRELASLGTRLAGAKIAAQQSLRMKLHRHRSTKRSA